jgi:succinyl-CoA:(S)-malate CoA-transferase subunit B
MVAIDDEESGDTIMVPNVVPRLSKTPGRIEHLGPRLGEHTDEILRDMLGLSDAEIGELRNQRVI